MTVGDAKLLHSFAWLFVNTNKETVKICNKGFCRSDHADHFYVYEKEAHVMCVYKQTVVSPFFLSLLFMDVARKRHRNVPVQTHLQCSDWSIEPSRKKITWMQSRVYGYANVLLLIIERQFMQL